MSTEHLLSLTEALAYLEAAGVPRTRTAIMRRITSGVLPAHKVGAQWVISTRQLDTLATTLEPRR